MDGFTDVAGPEQRIRILIVEDHPVFRNALTRMLNSEGNMQVCGVSDSVDGAFSLVRELRPDLAIVDISLRSSSGIDLISMIRESCPDLRVLVLSMHEESLYAMRAVEAGAGGYVVKREAAEEILPAIRGVMRGEIYISESIDNGLRKKH